MFQKGENEFSPKKITDYQSANAGAVSDDTNPEILHTVELTPTKRTSK
jgi:hypothetical protein